jgi:hypothetical protein
MTWERDAPCVGRNVPRRQAPPEFEEESTGPLDSGLLITQLRFRRALDRPGRRRHWLQPQTGARKRQSMYLNPAQDPSHLRALAEERQPRRPQNAQCWMSN